MDTIFALAFLVSMLLFCVGLWVISSMGEEELGTLLTWPLRLVFLSLCFARPDGWPVGVGMFLLLTPEIKFNYWLGWGVLVYGYFAL